MASFTDTHCHLAADELYNDLDHVLKRANEFQVQRLIGIFSLEELSRSQDILNRYPHCLSAYGIHPLFLPTDFSAHLSALETQLETRTVSAIGEIGLDYYLSKANADEQRRYFEAQLILAKRHDLPVLLHMRRSIEEATGLLKKHRIHRGIAHAFSGSREQARQLIALGFKISFSGTVTYPQATKIRQMARDLPLDAIVLETDAPDLPPLSITKQVNRPGHLLEIAQTVAILREISLEALSEATEKNVDGILNSLS